MKVPLSWLKEFVAIDAEVEEIARRLTAAGVEVEAIDRLKPAFSQVVVAKVIKVARHPNADRLTICEVDFGAPEHLSVVCGAPNVKAGMKAAFARVGAQLAAAGHGDASSPPPPLEAATIRGVRSEGMLCSGRELGLSEEHQGILALESNAPVGADLAAYLGLEEVVLDITITPNRGDCLSVLGLAREIAALFGLRLKSPKLARPASGEGAPVEPAIAVEVQAPEMCPHYAALRMDGVRIGPSPHWLKRRLELGGMRPINNVVDATNYVMLERGQPLHGFDLKQIEGGKIVVRRAGDYFVFVTLDNERRDIEPADLMIADGNKMLAIAGVMGGLNSEVGESTGEIILESAYFEPMAIAKTARRLGLRSEASYRFERGIDREGQVPALLRAAAIIRKIAGGRQVGPVIDVEPRPAASRQIELHLDAIDALLGVAISGAEARRRLRALGATVSGGAGRLRVVAPSFRPDWNEQADLAEEIARLSGLEEIPALVPAREAKPTARNPTREFLKTTREVMLGCGLTEVRTIAFIAPSDNQRFPGLEGGAPVKLRNPLSAELSELRLSLIPGLLAATRFNLNRQAAAFHAFEVAKVFACAQDGAPGESERLAAVSFGPFALESIGSQALPAGFLSLKGVTETFFQALGLSGQVEFERAGSAPAGFLHPGRAALIKLGGKPLGYLGELHPREAMRLELNGPCATFELDIKHLIAYGLPAKSIEPPPRFPAVRRDLALVLDREFPAGGVVATVKQIGPPILERVELFNVYVGEPIAAGKKSLALALSYRAKDRTLTDEEVNRAHAELVGLALARLGAQLRQ